MERGFFLVWNFWMEWRRRERGVWSVVLVWFFGLLWVQLRERGFWLVWRQRIVSMVGCLGLERYERAVGLERRLGLVWD